LEWNNCVVTEVMIPSVANMKIHLPRGDEFKTPWNKTLFYASPRLEVEELETY